MLRKRKNRAGCIPTAMDGRAVPALQNADSNGKRTSDKSALPLLVRFAGSSLAGTAVDLGLFALLVALLRGGGSWYIPVATAVARVISCACSYLLNHMLVFKSDKSMRSTTVRYVLLSVGQLALSAAGVTLLFNVFGGSELLIKIGVDMLLFFLSYGIQEKYVF